MRHEFILCLFFIFLQCSIMYIEKVVINFVMFLGKLGSLTIVFSLAARLEKKVRYLNEDIHIR